MSDLRDFSRQAQALAQNRDLSGLFDLLAECPRPHPARLFIYRALSNLVTRRDTDKLLHLYPSETDRAVRKLLLQTFGKLADDAAIGLLIETLKDRDALLRVEAAAALSRYNSEAAYQALLAALDRRSEPADRLVRQYAAEALGKLGDRRSVPALVKALRDPDQLVPPAAALALGSIGDRAALPALMTARHLPPHSPATDCALCHAIETAMKQF